MLVVPLRALDASRRLGQEEYEKLKGYDADPCLGRGAFLCHQPAANRQSVCKGWLVVHRDSIPVRLECMLGNLRVEDIPREGDPALYSSGTEAARAGMRGVRRPTRAAKRLIDNIDRNRRRRP